MTYFAMSSDGRHTAGAVQVEDVDSGEIHKFQEGSFSAALDGIPWDSRFRQRLEPFHQPGRRALGR
jgi:hypothetical protein